jgi:hypothetical protein
MTESKLLILEQGEGNILRMFFHWEAGILQ